MFVRAGDEWSGLVERGCGRDDGGRVAKVPPPSHASAVMLVQVEAALSGPRGFRSIDAVFFLTI